MSEKEASVATSQPTMWDDSYWTGPRFLVLLVTFMLFALTVIFVCSSLKSGDYSWYPFANSLKHSALR